MMNVKRWLSVLAVVPLGFAGAVAASGCDEHPREGQVENERVSEGPDAGRRGKVQAGAQGSELVVHTEEPMEPCIQVVEQVMRCTTDQNFIERLTTEEGGDALTEDELSRLAQYWREPGAQRQSCRQIFAQQTNNPFREADKRKALAEATNQPCNDFVDALESSGAVEIIGNVDVAD